MTIRIVRPAVAARPPLAAPRRPLSLAFGTSTNHTVAYLPVATEPSPRSRRATRSSLMLLTMFAMALLVVLQSRLSFMLNHSTSDSVLSSVHHRDSMPRQLQMRSQTTHEANVMTMDMTRFNDTHSLRSLKQQLAAMQKAFGTSGTQWAFRTPFRQSTPKNDPNQLLPLPPIPRVNVVPSPGLRQSASEQHQKLPLLSPPRFTVAKLRPPPPVVASSATTLTRVVVPPPPPPSTTTTTIGPKYPTGHGVDEGLLSHQPFAFFQQLRDVIDHDDPYARCARYGYQYNATGTPRAPRRIFFGALLALEPWEVLEIVGTETYGIFAGLVWVESNRTQNFTPRKMTRQRHGPQLAQIFGVPEDHVKMRVFVNENPLSHPGDRLKFLSREHAQRQEILKGWLEMGMQPEDLGFLADADETLTRDFFRALQYCDGIDLLDYEKGRCRHDVTGIKSTTLIYESSPDCPTQRRRGFRPDLFVGHCIEGIGDTQLNPLAPRKAGSIDRAVGWGYQNKWTEEDKVEDGRYPLYDGADMRKIGGAQMVHRQQPGYEDYTGYHLHNFFSSPDAIRHKYRTYGHADQYGHNVDDKRLEDLSEDLGLMARCVTKAPPIQKKGSHWNPIPGGFSTMKPPYPLYFADADYRQRRHEFISAMVHADYAEFAARASNQSAVAAVS